MTTNIRKSPDTPATERLKRLVEAELAHQGITHAHAARSGGMPGSVFQSLLRRGKRPTLDRAEEICKGLGISMTIGAQKPAARK